MTDVESLAEQVDENTSLRTPETSHPLEPDAEENKLLWWIGYFFRYPF